MGRVLGLDVGDKRIGVALSDETRLIASPYCVIQSVGWGPDSRKIADIMRETGAELIVSGLPYNMDGSLGFQAKKVQDFLKVVEGLGFRVEWIDERLTTVSAQNALIEGGMRREDRRNHVDKVAAAVILQTWLDKEREKKEQPMADNEKNLRMEEGGSVRGEVFITPVQRTGCIVVHFIGIFAGLAPFPDGPAGDFRFLRDEPLLQPADADPRPFIGQEGTADYLDMCHLLTSSTGTDRERR